MRKFYLKQLILIVAISFFHINSLLAQCPVPPLVVPISSTSVNVCLGVPHTLNAVSLPNHTYVWLLSGGVAQGASNQSSINVIWNSTGQKSVRVYAVNTCGGTGIVEAMAYGNDKIFYVVNNSDYTISPITGSTQACIGSFNYKIDPNPSISSVTWSVTGPNSNTDWSIMPIVDPSTGVATSVNIGWGNTPGAHTVTATTSNACGGPTKTKTLAVNVDFSFKPTATLINSPSEYVCLPFNGGSTVKSYTVTGSVSYQWELTGSPGPNGTLTSSGNTAQVTWNQLGQSKLYVTPSSSGCVGDKIPFNFYINSTPNPGVLTVSKTAACPNETITLTLTGSAFPQYSVYELRKYYFNPISGNFWGGWETIGQGGTSLNYTVPFNDSNQSGVATQYEFRATYSLGGCKDYSIPVGVTRNAPPLATVAPDTPVTFCGSGILNANTGANLTYQWYKNSTIISGATTASLNVTQSATYYVKVTNTITTCSALSAAPNITINPLPTATISPSPSVSFCVSGVLTANTGANLTHQWMKDGAIISGAIGSTFTATQSGSYQVRVTNSTTTCASTSTPTTVTINTLPAATISPSPSVSFCVSGVLTANTGANLTHQWFKDGAIISGAIGSTLTATQSGSYQVRVTNSTTTCASTSTPTTVTINSLPTTTISQSPSVAFCVSGVLTANTGANLTHQWMKDGNIVSGAIFSTYTATQSGNYQVRVTNSVTTCYNTSTPTSVTINTLPSATINPSPSATFCGSGELLANTGPNLNYQWIKNGIDISGTASTYPVTQSGSYQVRVTNSTTSCFSTSTSSSITINPYPTAAITSSSSDLCIGNSGQVSGTITASGSWTLTLSNGGGTVTGSGSGTWSIGVTPNSSITYAIESLTDANCSAASGALTGSTTFTIYTPYDPYIISLYDVCSYGYTELLANGAYGATGYEWSNGGTGQSTYANPYTTYTVVAKFGDCSSNPVSYYVEPCIEQYCYDSWGNQYECLQPFMMAEGVLGIYPNPASDIVSVQVPVAAEVNLDVTIHSQLGTEVGRTSILKGKTETSFDARKLADGIYIITLKAPNKVIIRQKVIIKH